MYDIYYNIPQTKGGIMKIQLLTLSAGLTISGFICLLGKQGLTGWAHAGLLIASAFFFFSAVLVPAWVMEYKK